MTFLTFSPKEKKESPSQTPSLERTEDSFLYQSLRSVAPPPQAQGSIQSLQRATAEASVLPPSLPSSELPSSQKGGLWKTSFLRLRAYFQVLGSSSQKSSQENDLEWLFSTPALFLYLLFALSYLLSFIPNPFGREFTFYRNYAGILKLRRLFLQDSGFNLTISKYLCVPSKKLQGLLFIFLAILL